MSRASWAGVSVRVAILKIAAPAAAADFVLRTKFGPGRRVVEVVPGKDQPDVALSRLADERLHLPDGPQLEIDKGGVIEKAFEQGSTRDEAESPKPPFRRVARGENERGAQLRDRASHFP